MTNSYKKYKDNYIKKHKTTHGMYSEKAYTTRCTRKSTIFAVADFETTAVENYSNADYDTENRLQDSEGFFNVDPTQSYMFLCGFKFSIDDEIYITYEDMKDFFDKIASWCKAHSLTKIKCYFHNLKFDGSFILSYLLKHNFRQTTKKNRFYKTVIGHKEFQALITGGKWFSLEFKWNNVRIQFLDSLKLNPHPLRKIGESIGMYKGEADYSKFKLDPTHNYPSEWIEYLKQDVRITEQVMLNHLKSGNSLNKMTIGSCAYSLIKDTIERLLPNYDIKRYLEDEKGYFGGFCASNAHLQGKWIRQLSKIRCIDRNSMHPSSMCLPLPYGKPLRKQPKGEFIEYYKILVRQADIKPKYSDVECLHIPYEWINGKRHRRLEHKDVNYIAHLDFDAYTYYLWKEELDILLKFYDIDYDILEVKYYRCKPYLKEIVEQLYVKKRDATDSIVKDNAKRLINNLYGKCGMKPIKPMDFYGEEWRVDKEKYEIKGEKLTSLTINHFPALLIQEKKQETDKANPVILASFITAMSRVSLLSMIKYIIDIGNQFLYCDTDSVFFVENVEGEYNIGEELGQWKFEKFKQLVNGKIIIKYKADGFISLAPKHYRVVMDNTRYPVKMGAAGCKLTTMFEVLNQDYNYDLIVNKAVLLLGELGYIVGSSEYNFRKYAKKIKVSKVPEEFVWKEM